MVSKESRIKSRSRGRSSTCCTALLKWKQRFSKFCDLLSEMGANNWTIATYYQFLASDGKWMFMKPSIMKRMADSLKVALNYKAEPNWLTYSKLQELADRVELELHNRGLSAAFAGSTCKASFGRQSGLKKVSTA